MLRRQIIYKWVTIHGHVNVKLPQGQGRTTWSQGHSPATIPDHSCLCTSVSVLSLWPLETSALGAARGNGKIVHLQWQRRISHMVTPIVDGELHFYGKLSRVIRVITQSLICRCFTFFWKCIFRVSHVLPKGATLHSEFTKGSKCVGTFHL